MKDIKLFESEETYNDYPAAAKANAKKAIEWKEKYGRDEVKGGTEVGWARAHQLANGENLSAETVGRMSAFNRHRKNSKIAPEHKDEPWKDNGYIAWLIWGGDEGVDWAIDKMKEIKKNESKSIMKHVMLFEEFLLEKEDKSTSREKLENDAVNKGLDKKSKESGVPIGILRAVMRRGMGAWNSSHYEGMTQEARGYARVNAFLEKGKGTWGGADADLAKEVRDGGHDKKLPYKSKD